MNRAERRFKSEIKDLKRRKLYVNHAINGRFEVNDESAEVQSFLMDCKRHRNTLNPYNHSNYERVKNGEGHWSQYPKNKYYGSNGYKLKHKTYKERKEEEMFASQE